MGEGILAAAEERARGSPSAGVSSQGYMSKEGRCTSKRSSGPIQTSVNTPQDSQVTHTTGARVRSASREGQTFPESRRPSFVHAEAEVELAQASRDAAKVLGVAFSETHSEPDYVP